MRRDRPDWLYLQGWGAMNPTAVEEAAKNGFRMDHLIGVWWSGGDADARPAGIAGKGYSTLDINGVGQNYPAIQDILKYVVDKGKSQVTSKDQVGENLYDRGVMNAVLIAEGIRNAQKLTGKKLIDGTDMRRGLESLNISDARWKELGLSGFAEPNSSELHRPQRTQQRLSCPVGRDEMEQRVRLDRTDPRQGSTADR